MIPSVRNRIDQGNHPVEGGDGDNNGQRVSIPPEELAELYEFRKREYFRKGREELDAKLLALATDQDHAMARADQIVGNGDLQRPFGLPDGQASHDIWEMILDHVHDPVDIMSLRDTCQYFRSLLKLKNKIMRLIEVALKFPNALGGRRTLLSLRLVSKSFKSAVDQKFLGVEPPVILYLRNYTKGSMQKELDKMFPKPMLYLTSWFPNHPLFLPSVVSSLEEDAFPRDTFPIRKITLAEHGFEEEHLPVVRYCFQRILELVGASIRGFRLSTLRDGMMTYLTVRSWVTLMPELESLEVTVTSHRDPPPALPLPPFPACPKLWRYLSNGLGLRAVYIAQILRANPWIIEVFLCDDDDRITMEMLQAEEVAIFREAHASTQLETFCLSGPLSFPRQLALEFLFNWPPKSLTLTFDKDDEDARDSLPSRQAIGFVNAFSPTLEELVVNWKLHVTGGYLDLPKLKKLVRKLWPDFMQMEFSVALEGLQYLDLHVGACPGIEGNVENAKTFINKMNLPSMFPGLKVSRTNFDRISVYAYDG